MGKNSLIDLDWRSGPAIENVAKMKLYRKYVSPIPIEEHTTIMNFHTVVQYSRQT